MGMFDKDKEIGVTLEGTIPMNEHFILWSVLVKEGDTDRGWGPEDRTTLLVSNLDKPEEKYSVSTLSGNIAKNAKEAHEDDFPAVVFWSEVNSGKGSNKARIIRFFSEYKP